MDERSPETVFIAKCSIHGLHGDRSECFVCGGPVEQVAMVPAQSCESLERLEDMTRQWRNLTEDLLSAAREMRGAADQMTSAASGMREAAGTMYMARRSG